MDRLRWPITGSGTEPQGSLFDADAMAERHVGRGEFAGYEFLHVNARSLINEVPAASRMPFRYTINAYRGCSHACSYCLVGDTRVLMADGRTEALRDLRPGAVVVGTVREGAYRRCVRSTVLDHWSTTRSAYRVTLADGTALVASADHRFLTDRGWKHVEGAMSGARCRPHLTTHDRLVGMGGAVTPPDATQGDRSGHLCGIGRGDALGVVCVQPLGVDLPMYDITTETGDFIANGVISHNCFARPTHEYLGLGMGEDFERRIVVKVNAVEKLRAELAARRWAGAHIAMGTNTDPYQRCEGKYRLTRGIIGVLGEHANPFSILTKSTLVLRDTDLLAAAAARTEVRVNLSIGTLDEEVWRRSEPGTPAPRLRLEAVRRLNDAGIPCGVLVAPVLPGLSDRPEQLAETVDAVVAVGATSISCVALHLRGPMREHYLRWLEAWDPDLAASVERRYRGAYLPAGEQRALAELVRGLVARARGRTRVAGGDVTARVREQMGGDARGVASPPAGQPPAGQPPAGQPPAGEPPAGQLSLLPG